jgi:hypothetical protein
VESVRRVYSERARGNFAAGAELFAADAIWTWEVPEGRTVSHGLEEAARNLRAFLDQWEHFRVEADELIELDERSILVVGRIHGRGKQSAHDPAPTRSRSVSPFSWGLATARSIVIAELGGTSRSPSSHRLSADSGIRRSPQTLEASAISPQAQWRSGDHRNVNDR